MPVNIKTRNQIPTSIRPIPLHPLATMQNGIYHTNPPPRRAHLSYDAITQIEDILGHNFNQNSYPELWLAFTSAGNHWLAQTGESVLFLVLARCIGEFEEDDELYGSKDYTP